MVKSLSILALGAALTRATRTPLLDWDPNTVQSCVEWYNNGMEQTCEYVRDSFGITPEQFSSWNPSIGLDCKPWKFQSYCIVTRERNEEYSRTHTPTTTSATKSTTPTSTTKDPGPSPTSWEDKGCYAERADKNILDKLMSGDGDDALTIPKCKDLCYRERSRFAGLKNGNQCWCSNYVIGDHAKNQADCNLPCTGDKATICGGKDLINVFEAYRNTGPVQAPTTTADTSSTVSSARMPALQSSAVEGPRSSSGAMRNAAIFGHFRQE